MKIYFEDGYLVLGRNAPDFNFVVNSDSGLTNNERYLEFLLKMTPDCTVYTNSLVAVHNKYCWNAELKIPELYIRRAPTGEWTRVDQLTQRELREGHNLLNLYWSGGFNNIATQSDIKIELEERKENTE